MFTAFICSGIWTQDHNISTFGNQHRFLQEEMVNPKQAEAR